MRLIVKNFDELTTIELHKIYKLRCDVFVVEQNCAYPEVDELDLCSAHMWYEQEETGEVLAYLRIVPPGAYFAEASLGRIVILHSERGSGLGKRIVEEGINKLQSLYPGASIHIEAQVQARGFYQKLGFVQVTDPYDDAGVMHVGMVKSGR